MVSKKHLILTKGLCGMYQMSIDVKQLFVYSNASI